MKKIVRLVLGFAVVVALATPGVSAARSRDRYGDDHELARSALQKGEVLPITRILEVAGQHLPGDVVEVKLDSKRGRLYYEIKVLTRTGRVRELVLDARTGAYVGIDD